MHRRLKERLIGAAVLVMLAVIFIPMILDDTSQTDTAITQSNIPVRSDDEFNSRIVQISGTSESDSQKGPGISQENYAREIASEAVARVSTRPVEKEIDQQEKSAQDSIAKIEDVGLTAWVVQLGSFSNEKNANTLNDELRKAGFPSFVEPRKQGTKVIYRVRVGPELLRSDAQVLKDQLENRMKMDGIILAYP